MADKKKTESKNTVKVKVDGKVGNGKGGYFKKGDTFEPGVGCDVKGLKDRGLVE